MDGFVPRFLWIIALGYLFVALAALGVAALVCWVFDLHPLERIAANVVHAVPGLIEFTEFIEVGRKL
jgi:uncharacterized membrane protein YqjE